MLAVEFDEAVLLESTVVCGGCGAAFVDPLDPTVQRGFTEVALAHHLGERHAG